MRRTQSGLSLLELILVIGLVSFLTLLLFNLPASIAAINKSIHQSIARDIAGKKMGSLRKQAYSNLANGTSTFTDGSLQKLPQPSASFTIEDCPEGVCTTPLEAKKVTVTVLWKETTGDQRVDITTLVAKGGIGQ